MEFNGTIVVVAIRECSGGARGKGQAANVLRSVGTGIGDCERFLSPRVDCTVRHDAALLTHFSQRIRGSRHDGRTAGDAGGAVYGFILLEHYYSPRDLERQVAAFNSSS
jgi:hypothetical protein